MPKFYVSKSKVKSKAFTMKLGDLPNMVDAVFDGHHKMPGWVHMFANAKGCDHVDGLFPEAHIKWRGLPPGLPNDWRGMQVNLPEAVSATKTNLPLEVIPAGLFLSPRRLQKQTCCLKSSRPDVPSTI